MFTLVIKRADQSIYWTQYFNNLPEVQTWLAKEQTRPYWLQEYTSEITDNTPAPPSQEQVEAEANAEASRKTQVSLLKARLAALDDQPDLTAAELKESVRKLFKLLKAMKLFE